jgi:glycosyltransferase involved in cell wall biosynthesis
MKIAIVAPSPIPFTIGGAENLFWGLQEYINAETPHQCELIKVPSAEGNFWEIIDSYQKFSIIDLSYFDLLISTKYPAWMVNHGRHVCYMQHTLRGLYDTYHFSKQPELFSWDELGLGPLRRLMDQLSSGDCNSASGLAEFFGRIRELRHGGLPEDTFRFPGPFIRQLVHFMDGYGMSPSRISAYAAISHNVRRRENYFPGGVDVSVVYHPPRKTEYFCRNDDFLFTASRLDGPKRIRMLTDAMKHVKSDIPLIIAGTGPDEQQLLEIAQGDPRIRFLGFVRDADVIQYYADALAVPFVPYDEDYGLITIEAMMSSKPVLTVVDSGGPNEFVRNGETGYSVVPDAKAIAERIDYMCTHRSETRQMGLNALECVRGIGWSSVARIILAEPGGSKIVPLRQKRSTRKKLVVATTFPVYPPRGGGQSRIFNLYRNLARSVDVDLVTLCNRDEPAFEGMISPGLREIRVPKSEAHHQKEAEYSRSVDWVPLTDVVMPVLYQETPVYVDALASCSREAFAVVASHPYVIDALEHCAPSKPLWFEAHNVEYELKRDIFPSSDAGKSLLDLVRRAESRCWHACEVAFACTMADLQALRGLYGNTHALSIEVPNGVAIDEVPFHSEFDRLRLKATLGLDGRLVAVFMGSWHGPNLTAIEFLLSVAEKLPSVTFVVVGSAGLAFGQRELPLNVLMTGPVDDEAKCILLGAADIALNPLTVGSGSNLKMLDYAAAGVPILSTGFGARGFAFTPGVHYISAELDKYVLELTISLATCSGRAAIADAARQLVKDRYSWRLIADEFAATLADRTQYFEMARRRGVA